MHQSVKSHNQKIAEAEVKRFQDALGPFVVAAETSKMAMIFTDATFDGNPIIFANDAYLEMTGLTREEVLGESFNTVNARTANAAALVDIKEAFEGSGGIMQEVMYRSKDETALWATLTVRPIFDNRGNIIQHCCSLVNLNRYKAQEAELRGMIQELNHRVKNTLATVQSIVTQALVSVEDRVVLAETIETRLSALSRSHDLLSRENWTGAQLRDVIDEALDPFTASASKPARFSIAGVDIRLPPKSALALGAGLNELAVNAKKYGALSDPKGSVQVAWTLYRNAQGPRLLMRWAENGGPAVKPPKRRGFGTRMIERGLTYELGGTSAINFRGEGVTCAIDFPLESMTDG